MERYEINLYFTYYIDLKGFVCKIELMSIFTGVCIPIFLQEDQGSEFYGYNLNSLMERYEINIYFSKLINFYLKLIFISRTTLI